ncbi:MAG TPA: hypothetical protein VK633_10165 [Verrucomicrobiae bacterium]|nr:hypothetical protein [Verrucomicrobiae bacterium]
MGEDRHRLLLITPLIQHSIPPLLCAGSEAAFSVIMNNGGHLPISETARRAGKAKARRGRPRKNSVRDNGVKDLPAVGTLSRTKSLLLAALRVWELKHRITD